MLLSINRGFTHGPSEALSAARLLESLMGGGFSAVFCAVKQHVLVLFMFKLCSQTAVFNCPTYFFVSMYVITDEYSIYFSCTL